MSEEISQAEAVTRRLRGDIMRSLLSPGSSISEAAVAARYAVGLASARAALRNLAAVGLVEARARRGHVISQVRVRDVREVYQLRLALEPLATRLAIDQIDVAQLRRREEEALVALRRNPGDASVALNHNRWFHRAIAEASGNLRLLRQLEDLHGEMERFAMIGLTLGSQVGKMLDQHMPIVAALEAGDADAAERTARAHVETAMRDVIDAIVSRDDVLERPLMELAS